MDSLQAQEPFERYLAAVTRDPRSAAIGLVFTDVTPLLSPHTLSLWFESAAALATFLEECGPSVFCDEESAPEHAPAFARLAAQIRARGLAAFRLDRLQAAVTLNLEFHWRGTFKELCAAKAEAARALIADFRGDWRRDAVAPIAAHEHDDFAVYISDLQNA